MPVVASVGASGAGRPPPGDAETVFPRREGFAPGDAPILMVASLETEDRAGDIVLASGWDLAAYRDNPVVLWAHDYTRPAIGRSLRTRIEGGALVAEIEFAPTPFAAEVRSLYLSGFMRGVSVGFRALETEVRTASNGRPAIRFKRQELLEISAAPVPLNPGALAQGDAPGGALRSELASALRDVAEVWRDLERLTGGDGPAGSGLMRGA